VRLALDALGGLRELQTVDIMVDTDQWERESDEDSQSFARNASLRAWNATSLEITGDILPFLARRIQVSTNVHMPPATFSSLQHLRLDNRLIVRKQAETDHLADLLSQFVQLKFLSLLLSSKSAGADQALSLDPVFDALNQLSRKTPLQQEVETDTGLQILCLQWSDLFHAHQAVVSADVLEKFLQYQLDHSEAISTIRKLSLCGLYFGSKHMEAVAKSLRGNIVLEDLTLSGHNRKHGGVTASCLQAILEVLENQNHTLKNISVYSSNEAQLSHCGTISNTWHRSDILTAASARPPPHHAIMISVDSNGNEDDHTRCCRLQEQMEIFCHLNRLGRATLVIPNATADDWIKLIAKCTADVSQKPMNNRNSSRLVSRANHLRDDDDDYTFQNQSHDNKETKGLDKIFLLLRMYPSLFYAGDRPAFHSSVPPELEWLRAPHC